MRPSNYARTPPKAQAGFAVLVVRLAVVIMGRKLMRKTSAAVNGFWG